jgi:hypothetical protein
MNTLPWFERNLAFGYPAEMLPFFLERLQGTAVRIQAKVNGLDNTILSEKLNGKWSIKQHIGHLAEVDEIANKRLDEMVNGISPMSPAVFEPQDYNPWPIEKVVDFFTTTRLRNIEKYKTLGTVDLQKSSLHPRLQKQMTPVDLAWFDAEHDDHHLVKISEIISELKK